MPIHLAQGDITQFEADAIVNAANSLLVVGGGVSSAIYHAAGASIAEECATWIEENGPVAPGGSAITSAGILPARYIVHAVGPMWHGGESGEPEQLAEAYRSATLLADENGLTSIAFPSISTGIFGYPVELAAPVAVTAIRDVLRTTRALSIATIVLFDAETYAEYEKALGELYG